MASRESNVALVRALYQRLLVGDLQAVQSRLDAKFVLRATDSLPYGGRREGVGALVESMQDFLKHWFAHSMFSTLTPARLCGRSTDLLREGMLTRHQVALGER